MKKKYNNKIVKKVLNAYVQAIRLYDTTEIHLGLSTDKGVAGYAFWHNGRICVTMFNGEVISLSSFNVKDSNAITNCLINAMKKDLRYFGE